MTIMEELSMKNTLKAGDERKIEEEFFQYIVIRLGDEQTNTSNVSPVSSRPLTCSKSLVGRCCLNTGMEIEREDKSLNKSRW